MSILSFGKSNSQKQAVCSDWSNQEMADFFRAHRLLVQNGASIGLDRGLSDKGEPWLVFFDTTSQDVFLHIARINGQCILVCDHLDIRISASRIEGLINKFEEEIRQAFTVRAERPSNVVMHPAAKIIMSISAVFLLFKLDSNSQSFAKEAADHGLETGARKGESIHVRVQAALARLFDGAETPAAMAALASVILASDIALDHIRHQGDSEDDAALTPQSSHQESLELHSAVHIDQAGAAETDALETELKGGAPAVADDSGQSPAPEVQITAPVAEVAAAVNIVAMVQSDPLAPQQTAGSSAPATAAAEDTSASAAPTKVVLTAPSASTPVLDEPLSLQAIKTAIALDFDTVPELDLTTGLLISASGEILTLDPIGPLPSASAYGFKAETHFNTDDVLPMLEHIISQLGAYELEVDGNVLSIVQMLGTGNEAPDLGKWTNIMSDGSSIAIVGALDLIDDVGAILTAA